MGDTISFSSLVIDSDRAFLQKLKSGSPKNILHFTSSFSEASNLIQSPKDYLHSIFLNPNLYGIRASQLISLIRRHRPVTPVYFLYEGKQPFSDLELARLGIRQAIPKAQALNLMSRAFDSEIRKISEKVLSSILQTGKERQILFQKDGFVKIPAGDFLAGYSLLFDLYVLEENTYKKISQAKDALVSDTVRIYLDKGVDYFYIRKESHERLQIYSDLLKQRALKSGEGSIEFKQAETFDIGQDLIEEIKKAGFKADHVELVVELSKRIFQILPQFQDTRLLQNFLRNIQAYDHAVSCTVLSGLLCLALNMESEAIHKNVSVAAFFHDLGLYRLPVEIQRLKESEMTHAQRTVYRTHPEETVKVLKEVEGISEIVLQAIAQHHLRKDRSGFPSHIPVNQINRIAEVIGMSEEFLEILSMSELDTDAKRLSRMEPVLAKFSFQVAAAFKKVFTKL